MPRMTAARATGSATSRPSPDSASADPGNDAGTGNALALATTVETAEELLRDVYGPVRIHARGPRRGLRLQRSDAGPVQLHHVTLTMDFDAAGALPEALVFTELTAGRVSQGPTAASRHYVPGDVFLAGQPGGAYTATVRDADLLLTVIDPALPAQVAGVGQGGMAAPVRFTGYQPVSATAAAQWTGTVAFLRDHLLANPDAASAPLVIASAARLVAAAALAAFPNTALTEPTPDDRHDGSPATLRRAVAYIDEHVREDITLAHIAAHARVTIRAVQLAFRRHLDTTPTAYVRRVRLDRAHRQLADADPAHESVTAVSYQWGFASPSRFAAYYRAAYGVPPSRTLHA